jgi:four helix bundle protein
MQNDFNNKYCLRTKQFAIKLCTVLDIGQPKEATRIIIRQVIRSGTSMAANFRAASRARSRAEYYAKICIVVEETDETLFWIDLLKETRLIPGEKLEFIQREINELLKIFSTTKKNLKPK